MAELFEAVASWPTLLLVLLVFGFAPGFVLRLLVLAYPRSDPRRRELIAELYAVHRIQRPLWVAEQLEVALFEGLAHRASAAIRSLTRQRRARTQTGKRGGRIMASDVAWGRVGVVVGVVVGVMVAVVAGVITVASAAVTVGAVAAVTTGMVVVAVAGIREKMVINREERAARRRLSARARRRFWP